MSMVQADLVLAIDCGNTNTRFCLLQGLALVADWRRATDDNRTADEDLVWLTQLMSLSGFEPARIRNVVVASVRPQSTFGLKRLSQKLTNRDAIVVGEGDVILPVADRLIRPGQVGADRLVNARALKDTDQVPAIVVDFGTATTFDYVDEHGAYAGGVIAPGVHTSIGALYQAAAKLPLIDLVQMPPVLGTDTVSAMQSGVFWGYIGLVEGIISQLKRELSVSVKVIATGGLAALFDTATEVFDSIDGDLTLKGLALVERDFGALHDRQATSRQ